MRFVVLPRPKVTLPAPENFPSRRAPRRRPGGDGDLVPPTTIVFPRWARKRSEGSRATGSRGFPLAYPRVRIFTRQVWSCTVSTPGDNGTGSLPRLYPHEGSFD